MSPPQQRSLHHEGQSVSHEWTLTACRALPPYDLLLDFRLCFFCVSTDDPLLKATQLTHRILDLVMTDDFAFWVAINIDISALGIQESNWSTVLHRQGCLPDVLSN